MQFSELLIIAMYLIHYPIMELWNQGLSKPLAMIFEDITEVKDTLKAITQNAVMLQNSCKLSDIKEKVRKCNTGVVFWLHPVRSVKQTTAIEEKVSFLQDAMAFKWIEDTELRVPIVFVFNRILPEEFDSEFFPVYIEKNSEKPMAVPYEHFDIKDLSLVKDKVEQYSLDETKPFKCAITFLYPTFKAEGKLDLFEEYLQTCENLVRKADNIRSRGSVEVQISKCFLEHFESGHLKIMELTENILTEDMFEYCGFYKDSDFYITESLFKKLIADVIQVIPIELIKATLVESGALKGKLGSYTSKVAYTGVSGTTEKRMMKFTLESMPELQSYVNE